MSVVRGHVLGSTLSVTRASDAIAALTAIVVALDDCQALLDRIWELRHNLTSYDAAYVSLAERLGVPLVTADARLINASGVTCRIIAP